jgi:hypothetical protein
MGYFRKMLFDGKGEAVTSYYDKPPGSTALEVFERYQR